MGESIEVTNIKNEPTDSTSSDRLEISPEMQVNFVKQKSDCLIQSEIEIKTIPQKDEAEFSVIASTSYNLYPSYDIKFETEEPMIKMEHEDLVAESVQDPLDVGDEIKDKEHYSIDLDQGESGIKTEPIEEQKDKYLFETDKDSSHGSESNQSQELLLIRNNADCKGKIYICNECNKVFGWKSHLDRHLRIHTGEKPFKCSICENSFNTKGNLDTHMLIHSGERSHICNVCQKIFNQKSNLKSHMLIHSDVKPFSCHVCGKSFTQISNLVRHKRMHTGDKPFSCDVCNKAFTHNSHLTEHRRTHTGEKPYSCNICNKSFAANSNLFQHKKIHKD